MSLKWRKRGIMVVERGYWRLDSSPAGLEREIYKSGIGIQRRTKKKKSVPSLNLGKYWGIWASSTSENDAWWGWKHENLNGRLYREHSDSPRLPSGSSMDSSRRPEILEQELKWTWW